MRNAELLTTKLKLTPAKIATCATLLGRDPEKLVRNAEWFDTHEFQWENDPSMLSVNLDKMKGRFHYLTVDCAVPVKQIRKRHITRSKEFVALSKRVRHDTSMSTGAHF